MQWEQMWFTEIYSANSEHFATEKEPMASTASVDLLHISTAFITWVFTFVDTIYLKLFPYPISIAPAGAQEPHQQPA